MTLVMLRLHPRNPDPNYVSDDEPLDNETLDLDLVDPEALALDYETKVKVLSHKGISIDKEMFATAESLKEEVINIDWDSMSMILTNQDFLASLNPVFIIPRTARKDIEFVLDISMASGLDLDYVKVIRDKVLSKKARLLSSNFKQFQIESAILTFGTLNGRVLLQYCEFSLTRTQIDRILTLGLSYLCGFISYAETMVELQGMVSRTTEVTIIPKERTFVIIKMMPPVFTY